MAQNVVIAGATYNDVPSVNLITANDTIAAFVDTSDANAIADDILQGKTAYVDGEKIVGTGSGGGMVIHGDLIDCYADEALDSGDFVWLKNGIIHEKQLLKIGSYSKIEFLDDNHIITYINSGLQIHEFSFEDGIINSGEIYNINSANTFFVYDSTHVIVLQRHSRTSYLDYCECLLLKIDLDSLTIEVIDTQDAFSLDEHYIIYSSQFEGIVLSDFIIFCCCFTKTTDPYTKYYQYVKAVKIVDEKFVFYTSYFYSDENSHPLLNKYSSNIFIIGKFGSGGYYKVTGYQVSTSGSISNYSIGGSNYIIASDYTDKLYSINTGYTASSSTSVSFSSWIGSTNLSYGSLPITGVYSTVSDNRIHIISDHSFVSYITDSNKTYIFSTLMGFGSGMFLLDTISKNMCTISPSGKALLYSYNNVYAYIVKTKEIKLAYKHSYEYAYGITASSASAQYDPIQVYVPHT